MGWLRVRSPSSVGMATSARIARRGPKGRGVRVDLEHRVRVGGPTPVGHRYVGWRSAADGRRPGPARDHVNGEIYSLGELRGASGTAEWRFTGDADIEILIDLHDRHGRAIVEQLPGMLGLAIRDGDGGGVLVVREASASSPVLLRTPAAPWRSLPSEDAGQPAVPRDAEPSPGGFGGRNGIIAASRTASRFWFCQPISDPVGRVPTLVCPNKCRVEMATEKGTRVAT